MRFTYDSEADVLLIKLGAKPPVRAKDAWPDAVLHYNEDGLLAEIEVLGASRVCSVEILSQYETVPSRRG